MKRVTLLVLTLTVVADVLAVASLVAWFAWRGHLMSDDRAVLQALLTKASMLEAARQRASKSGDVTAEARCGSDDVSSYV